MLVRRWQSWLMDFGKESFLLTFLITLALVFQLPIVLLFLIRIGLLSPKTLAQKRRWALLAIVILAAVVAPTPDLFTQFLMAVFLPFNTQN